MLSDDYASATPLSAAQLANLANVSGVICFLIAFAASKKASCGTCQVILSDDSIENIE